MMNKTVLLKIFLILFYCSFQLPGKAQSKSLDVDKTYDFSPQKLNKTEKEVKVKAMDNFWNKVKSDTTIYLPLLRKELATNSHVPYFYFDGSGLLLWLSHSRSDEEIAAEAIAKCDLKDIDQMIYVQTLNHLAFDSINVLQASLKILAYPDFNFYLVQHAMYFNQENSLAYCLLPMQDTRYVDTLISRFNLADTTAQFSIMYTLWLGYSCQGDSLILAASKNKKLYRGVQAFADTLISQQPVPDADLSNSSVGALLEKRSDGLKRFSDEGLDDLINSTIALRSKTHCGLYAAMDSRKTGDKKALPLSEFAQLIIASEEFKSEQKHVDSLNNLSGVKRKLSFSVVENSTLDGDNPEFISIGFVNEESVYDRKVVYTMRYDKRAKKIVSIVRSPTPAAGSIGSLPITNKQLQ